MRLRTPNDAAGAAQHGQDDEADPDDDGVQLEVVGEAAADPGQLAVGLTTVQLAGLVHVATFHS